IHLHQPLGNPLARPYARTMLRRAARCAARVLTVSDTVGREIASELSCDASKIIVTPNGIDPDLTPADRRREHFLFVGNDKPHKNVSTAVAALGIVRRTLPEATLVIAGGSFERLRNRDGMHVRSFVARPELA